MLKRQSTTNTGPGHWAGPWHFAAAFSLLVALMSGAVMAAPSTYRFSQTLGEAPDEWQVFYNTNENTSTGFPTTFKIPTSQGDLFGQVTEATRRTAVLLAVDGHDQTLGVALNGPGENRELTERFIWEHSSFGTIDFAKSLLQEVPTLRADEVADCVGLGQDPLYLAVHEVSEKFAAFSHTSSTGFAIAVATPVRIIELGVRAAADLPHAPQQCINELPTPDNAICGQHSYEEDCVRCCDTERLLTAPVCPAIDAVTGGSCSRFVEFIELIAGSCENQCNVLPPAPGAGGSCSGALGQCPGVCTASCSGVSGDGGCAEGLECCMDCFCVYGPDAEECDTTGIDDNGGWWP